MSIQALKVETAQLAAEAAAIGCVIAVAAFHSVWQSPEEARAATAYNLNQVRQEVEAVRDKRQKRDWDVAIVAAELGIAESFVVDMFRAQPAPIVKLLAAEAAYGSDRKERNAARRELSLPPEPKKDDKKKEADKENQDDLASDLTLAAELGLVAAAGWRALTVLTQNLLFGMSTGRSGRRRARLREWQADIAVAPKPVVMPAPNYAMDF